jgi:hypothetical protein
METTQRALTIRERCEVQKQAHGENIHPTLDHLVINARDQLDAAVAAYIRLGFQMTPRGYHTLGSMNHLAVLEDNYLELVGVPPGNLEARPELSRATLGLNGYVLRTDDAAQEYQRLLERQIAAEPPGEFSRPVDIDGRRFDARFQTVRLQAGVIPAGRVYFCRHLTPELVWRREWQDHPNGAKRILASVWVVADPDCYMRTLSRIVGDSAVLGDDRRWRFAINGTTIELLEHSHFAAIYGVLPIVPDDGGDFMAGIRIRTRSLATAAACLSAHRIAFETRRAASIVVPALDAFNVVVEFCE